MVAAGSHSAERLISSRFCTGESFTMFWPLALLPTLQAVVATVALLLFHAFLQAGHGDGEAASRALLLAAWLAGGGQAGKACCRPC